MHAIRWVPIFSARPRHLSHVPHEEASDIGCPPAEIIRRFSRSHSKNDVEAANENATTNKTKTRRELDMPTLQEWIDCKNLPMATCNAYRERHGLPPLPTPQSPNVTARTPVHKKIRGLGDIVDAMTTATGIKRVVEAVSKATGVPCGCQKRRELLNKLVPFADADHIADVNKMVDETSESVGESG